MPLRLRPLLWFCTVVSLAGAPADPLAALAPKPPLGWNSFDGFGCAIYEELALKEVDVFIARYAPHGYSYFVIDNGWFSSPETIRHEGLMLPISQHARPEDVTIDEFGIPQPSAKFFPNGFRPLVERLHARGLKFGVHLMRGIPREAVRRNTPIKGTPYRARDIHTTVDDCTWCEYMHGVDMSKPGAQAYYDSVVAQLAAWGVDFLKVDDVVHKPAEIRAYRRAIEKCGRPMLLSISPGGDVNRRYLAAYELGQMVRTTHDIWDDQVSLDRSFAAWRQWQGLERPGFWPDLDMIPFGELSILKRPVSRDLAAEKLTGSSLRFGGEMYHSCKFTRAEKETFITQRAMAASPLMLGGVLATMDEESHRIVTNADMLACNQNGISGRLVHDADGFEVWLVPDANAVEGGEPAYRGQSGWVAVFNRRKEVREFAHPDAHRLLRTRGAAPLVLRDIWNPATTRIAPGGGWRTTVAANGVVFARVDLETSAAR